MNHAIELSNFWSFLNPIENWLIKKHEIRVLSWRKSSPRARLFFRIAIRCLFYVNKSDLRIALYNSAMHAFNRITITIPIMQWKRSPAHWARKRGNVHCVKSSLEHAHSFVSSTFEEIHFNWSGHFERNDRCFPYCRAWRRLEGVKPRCSFFSGGESRSLLARRRSK